MRNRELANQILTKKNVLTVPNALSIFRLLLIPVILVLCLKYGRYRTAALIIGISGLTDVLDGQIARRFSMVSDLGKLLDPLADKLTQACVLICLTARDRRQWILLAFLIVKELTQGILGYIAVRQSGKVPSAAWYGKVSTVLLYLTFGALLFFPKVPEGISAAALSACGVMLCIALILYILSFMKIIREQNKNGGQ